VASKIVHGVFFRERNYDLMNLIDFYHDILDAKERVDRLNHAYNSIRDVKPYTLQSKIAEIDEYGVIYTVVRGKNFIMASELATAKLNFEEAHAHAKRLNDIIERSASSKRFYVKAVRVK
jgi:hypothetical protein